MSVAMEKRSKAIELVTKFPPEVLDKAVELLEALQAQFERETALLQIIHQSLSPEDLEKLDCLRQRCEWDNLTESEYQELLAYEDWLENQNVARLEAIIQLAEIKNMNWQPLYQKLTPSEESIN